MPAAQGGLARLSLRGLFDRVGRLWRSESLKPQSEMESARTEPFLGRRLQLLYASRARLKGESLADAAAPPQTPSHASCRRYRATFALPPFDAHIASAIAAVGAKKRTSGFAAIPNNRISGNTLASADRIRENPPLDYDVASDAGVAAKSIASENSLPK